MSYLIFTVIVLGVIITITLVVGMCTNYIIYRQVHEEKSEIKNADAYHPL